MQTYYNNVPVRTVPKPSAARIKELAATGLDRAGIAASLGIKYKRLCYFLSTYGSLHDAFFEGQRIYKENKTDGKK